MTTRTKLLIGAAVIALVGAGAGGVWWFLKDDAPAEVSLDAAVESVAGADSGSGSAEDGSATGTVDGIEGSWVVDTETGELGEGAASGEPVAVAAVGDLTIHGVTRQVEIPLEAQLVDDTVVVTGSLDITFSDFDVDVPDSQVVVSVEDHGVMEMQLLLTQA